ncbi:MAG: hypothetical protein MI741_00475, partial [Rhodospirillales bacterium]|nr:hypothetical protein [Rhodospirillales bacterium]
VEAIDRAINQTEHIGKPLFVLCYSNSTQGVPLLDERKPNLHFVRFKDQAEMDRFKAFLDDWTSRE